MATISKVKIANMALSHVGASSTIESFSEDTAVANISDLWYDFSRLQVLEAFDWGFARKRLTLTVHSEDPPDDWGFRYQYPSDCVAVRNLFNPLGINSDAIPFEVELATADGLTKSILTDEDVAIAAYTMDLETTSMFSSFFVETLSFLLAHHIAFSITGKLGLRQQMLQAYQSYIQLAPSQNANERVGRVKRDAPWIRFRDGSLGKVSTQLATTTQADAIN